METNSRKYWIIGLVVIVCAVFGMWIFSPTEVVVTGTGKVSVPASTATFNVTLNSVNDNPDVAVKELETKVANIKKVLASVNIAADNVTETPLTLTPAAAIVASAKGYQAMTTLSVKMSNVAAAPQVVVSMYANGATLVSQPVVSVDDPSSLEKQALSQALKQARQNLGTTVGFRPVAKIIGIQQASSGNTATSTKTSEGSNGAFEVTKAVQLTYRVW